MEIKEVLINRKNKLLRIIEEKLESSGVNNSEKVIAIRHGNTFQYYIKNDNSVNNGVYVRKNKIQKVRKIVQIEYDKKVKIHAEKEVKLIDKILSLYSDCVVEDVYERMPKGKQLLVVPVRKNDLEYILEWCNQEYEALPFRDNTPEYYSLKGERMRSKSEVIIANILYKKNIVYKYEKPLFLDGKGYVYPDFTLLDVKRRRELYIEHLGLLDDVDYRNNSIEKIRLYEKNGYYLGERVIITGETLRSPLDIKLFEQKIDHILN